MTETFSIGASTIPGEVIIPKMMPEWIKRHPETLLRVHITDSRQTFEKVKHGDYEIGIIGARYPDDQVDFVPIEKGDHLVFIAHREHPLTKKGKVSLNDLKGQAFIVREAGSGTRASYEQALGDAGFPLTDLKVVAEIGSTDGVVRAVQAGAGISIVSDTALQEVTNCGDVVTLDLGLPINRDFYLVTSKKKPLSTQARDVLKLIEELV